MPEDKKAKAAKTDDGSTQISFRISPAQKAKLEAEQEKIQKDYPGLKVPFSSLISRRIAASLGVD